ncbi:transposase [Saccharibacillus sacchari]|uniref:transposase n=1 Tax=Saccharibacillus sacchari TaxID=456493 RepID=UPI000A042839|nr:transposase [Saccharibacillus sacchari]
MEKAQKGQDKQAIGRSRGGLTTKIHAIVDALGRLLSGKPEKWTPEEGQELWERLLTDEGSKARYDALQHFRYVLKSLSFPVIKKRLDGFLKHFSFHRIAAVGQIAKAVSSRKEGVLAAAVNVESNGPEEGINTKIKLLKRRAYGYRNMTHFLQRIQLKTGL